MNKKALFFDIDGTLIDNAREISEISAEVRKEFKQANIKYSFPVGDQKRYLMRKFYRLDLMAMF